MRKDVKTIDEIQDLFEDKQQMVQRRDYRTLRRVVLEKVRQHNLQPRDPEEKNVLRDVETEVNVRTRGKIKQRIINIQKREHITPFNI
jgi:hypothetical protein